MDRRKHQGVALWMGLLFLVLMAELILFYLGASELQGIEAQQVGSYTEKLTGQMQETEAISILNGKNEDGSQRDAQEQEKAKAAGEALQKKYGYLPWNTVYMKAVVRYGILAFGIFLTGCCAAGVLFWQMRRRENRILMALESASQQLKELDMRFQKTKQQLEKEEQETKSLITDISHQLKTPMAALQMSHEMLETTDLSEEERLVFRKREKEELHRLRNLMEALLELSKLESKLIQLHPESVSLRRVLTEAVNGIYMKAVEKQIDISVEEFEDINLKMDAKWTAEAFANILDNAVKYSPDQTEIKLRIAKMVSYVLVEVEDQGIGITSEEVHQIFKRFYRGKSENVKQEDGSGVGLYLARKIFEGQGGTICVKQAVIQGSIFQITLPLELEK